MPVFADAVNVTLHTRIIKRNVLPTKLSKLGDRSSKNLALYDIWLLQL